MPLVVLLGASNLTRGFAAAVDTARHLWRQPLEVLAAIGHGRSYGMVSSVLARSLPGIVECGLWPALDQLAPTRTAALITDVGNDILYGAAVAQIAAWVDCCIARLSQHNARIVVTLLPIGSLKRLAAWEYFLVRTVLFPRSRLRLGRAIELATELNDELRAMATQRGAALVEPRDEWYGLDRIHIKKRHWPTACREMFAPWQATPVSDAIGNRDLAARRLPRLAPARRWWFGIERRRAQPCATLADGSRISLY